MPCLHLSAPQPDRTRRAIATRYDKTATSYAAGIAIAATLDWFKAVR